MVSERIRPVAVGVPRRDDEIFVAELFGPDGRRFYRPVGGGIEFGEASRAALVREFEEELDVEVEVGDYLGTIENRFEVDGTEGHEVVLVHEVERTPELWDAEALEGQDDGGVTYTAEWRSLAWFEEGDVPLFPEGLRRLLREPTSHVGSG